MTALWKSACLNHASTTGTFWRFWENTCSCDQVEHLSQAKKDAMHRGAVRTPGGHRRYRLADVEAIARHQPGRFIRWWVPPR